MNKKTIFRIFPHICKMVFFRNVSIVWFTDLTNYKNTI